jgi:hypothetical protein
MTVDQPLQGEDHTLRLRKPLVFALMFLFFVIAYVVCPYWKLAPSAFERYALLGAVIAVGAAWAYGASGEVRVRIAESRTFWWGGLALLLLLLLALQWRAMRFGIPWNGDEDYHFEKTLTVAGQLGARWYVPFAGLIGCAVLMWFAARQTHVAPVLGVWIGIAVGIGAFLVLFSPVPAAGLTRYPFVSRLFAAAPFVFLKRLIPPSLPIVSPHVEFAGRLLPFLCAGLTAWVAGTRLRRRGWVPAMPFALAVATLPLLQYYSTVLCLEPPVVVLLTIVALSAEDLLGVEPQRLPTLGAWYALLAVGFIKETTVAILAAFMLCRLAFRFKRAGAGGLRGEILGWCYIALPLAVYVFFRKHFREARAFSPSIANLLNARALQSVAGSYVQQFGLLTLLAIAGLVVMWRAGQMRAVVFLVAAFAAHAAFHLLDDPLYAGYSRFNLFLIPMLIAGAVAAVDALADRSSALAGGALAAVLAVNFLLSPVNWDGTKKSDWGYFVGEQYYDYRGALHYINQRHPADRALLTGTFYKYQTQFYLSPGVSMDQSLTPIDVPAWTINPLSIKDDPGVIGQKLDRAARDGYTVVLYHLHGKQVPAAVPTGPFVREAVFANREHVLVLYSRQLESAKQ